MELFDVTHLLPGTASGLLPVRVTLCSDWLEEDELEDLASLSGWERCSSRGFCLFQTTIWGEEVVPFLLMERKHQHPHSRRRRKTRRKRRGTVAALTACDVIDDMMSVFNYNKNIIRIIFSYHTMNSVVKLDLCIWWITEEHWAANNRERLVPWSGELTIELPINIH